jgi:hypothetical protein
VPGLLQIGRHALAHHAEPDKTDLHIPLHSFFSVMPGLVPGIHGIAR